MRTVLRTIGTLTAAAALTAGLSATAEAATTPAAAPVQQSSVTPSAPSAGDWVATARWNHSYRIFRGRGETLDRAKDNALYSCHAYHPYTRSDCRIVDLHRVS